MDFCFGSHLGQVINSCPQNIGITGLPLWLEMLENERFSECGWKSWKTLGFSSALGGKAGILFLGLIIINSIIE